MWGGSLAAVVILWYAGLYRPQAQMSEQVRNQVNSLSQEVKAVTATEPRIEKLRQRLALLDSSIQQMEAKIYPKQRLPEVLIMMQEEGRKHGLQFKSIFPDYDILFTQDSTLVSSTGLMRIPVHFIMEGSYVPLGRYLETLPDMPWRVVVGGVDIRLWRESYPRLMIDLLAYIYVYDDSPEADTGGANQVSLTPPQSGDGPNRGSWPDSGAPRQRGG